MYESSSPSSLHSIATERPSVSSFLSYFYALEPAGHPDIIYVKKATPVRTCASVPGQSWRSGTTCRSHQWVITLLPCAPCAQSNVVSLGTAKKFQHFLVLCEDDSSPFIENQNKKYRALFVRNIWLILDQEKWGLQKTYDQKNWFRPMLLTHTKILFRRSQYCDNLSMFTHCFLFANQSEL